MQVPMAAASDQDLAYERAVTAVRNDPSQRALVESAFLHDDARDALAAFRASEHWARARRLLIEEGVTPPARVVDFGGGRGLLAAALALERYDATLCEINASAICGTGAAREVMDAAGVEFRVVSEPIEALANHGFAAVLCRAVLHHVAQLIPTLRDVRAALAPGGVFVASDEPTVRRPRDVARVRATHPFTPFGVDERAYTVRDYVRALEAAGFTDVRARFPVAFADYRQVIRPRVPYARAALRYALYRARSAARHVPGEVRAFTARAPAD